MKGQGKPLFEAIGPCPYCGGEPSLVTGAVLYPHRPDLAHKPFGRCAPCDATVGFHLDGRPLGTLAKPELRKLRGQAHDGTGRLGPLRRLLADVPCYLLEHL